MSKIDHTNNAIYHCISYCDQPVDRAKRYSIDELLDKIFHGYVCSSVRIQKICETIISKLKKDACLASQESQAHLNLQNSL